jgi:hypothetical protein
LYPARLSDQPRFFMAFDLPTELRLPTNAAILRANRPAARRIFGNKEKRVYLPSQNTSYQEQN